LNFSNRWYESAVDNHFLYKLLDDKQIKVINAPYFLCTKFGAYQDRGGEDEKDLEDIIYVIDGRPELIIELRTSPLDVRAYIAAATNSEISTGLLSRLDWFLPQDATGAARMKLVADRLIQIASIS
jgi:hypothetical protein